MLSKYRYWLFIMLLLLLVGCGGPLPPERSLETTATEMRFTPDLLTVRAGEKVFLRMDNAGQEPHNLILELPAADRTVSANPGTSVVLTFFAPQEPGRYRFYCDLPGHEAQVGTLVVEP
ncbi:MAG: cupredoxin domain-containing protein [Chloroflexaceae bacterium]|nr:cupredoxin domain-containing protein [Chloroflexaceae bacterium]